MLFTARLAYADRTRLSAIRWDALAELWTWGRYMWPDQILRYLEEYFISVESSNDGEMLVRR